MTHRDNQNCNLWQQEDSLLDDCAIVRTTNFQSPLSWIAFLKYISVKIENNCTSHKLQQRGDK